MANIKTLTVIALSCFFALGSAAHAGDTKQQDVKLPPELLSGEYGQRMADKVKAMPPEERKAFIEKFQARLKEARTLMQTITPAEHKRRKELRAKIEKMTPEERYSFREDPTQKKNEKDSQDSKPLPVVEAPPEPGSMMPKH